jgi:hypothetical protein
MSAAAITASSVLPVAIVAARNGEPCTRRLLAAAPSQMPGHTCAPAMSTEASAMPAAGHTAVA